MSGGWLADHRLHSTYCSVLRLQAGDKHIAEKLLHGDITLQEDSGESGGGRGEEQGLRCGFFIGRKEVHRLAASL